MKRLRRWSLLVLLLILVTVPSTSIDAVPSQSTNVKDYFGSYYTHEPFNITCNEDFELQGWNGSGLYNDPYRINGLNITAEVNCINIMNATAFFVVSDCLLTSANRYSYSVYEDTIGAGVYLNNVTNGIIEGCYINWKYHGILVYNTAHCQFNQNAIHQNMWCGIKLSEASIISITENTIFENDDDGIWSWKTHSLNIANNTIHGNKNDGIELVSSDNSTINDNELAENENGLSILSSENTLVLGNTIIGGYFGVYLNQISNATVISNIIRYMDGQGIFLYMINYSLFESNQIYTCERGVWLHFSTNCLLRNNSIGTNGRGILATTTALCIFTNNTLTNYEYDIWFDWNSTDNAFYWNTVSGGGNYLATDDGMRNLWDDNISLGNRWGDYIGFGVYRISGSAGSVDRYPVGFRLDSPILILLQGFGYVGLLVVILLGSYYLVNRKQKKLTEALESS